MSKSFTILAAIGAMLLGGVALGQGFQPFQPNEFKNIIDNPRFEINQRGLTTLAISASTTPQYQIDRWATYTQNTGQAVTSSTVTSGLPVPFVDGIQIGRTSGSNTTQVCVVQETATANLAQYQGQTLTLSFFALAGAGLATGDAVANSISVFVNTGTGTNEGLATLTGVAGVINSFTGAANPLVATQVITPSFVRYSFGPIQVSSTATELATQICYTPVGTKATNEFFEVTGVQLEASPQATAFEQRSQVLDLVRAQTVLFVIADTASGTAREYGTCFTTATTTALCTVQFPANFSKVPTTTVTTSASFGALTTAGAEAACSALAGTANSNTTNTGGLTCTSTGLGAAGSGTLLVSGATGVANTIIFSSEF